MDPEVMNFLKIANIESAAKYFVGFDFETFKMLQPCHFKDMIETPTERILIEMKFQQLLKQKNSPIGIVNIDKDPLELQDFVCSNNDGFIESHIESDYIESCSSDMPKVQPIYVVTPAEKIKSQETVKSFVNEETAGEQLEIVDNAELEEFEETDTSLIEEVDDLDMKIILAKFKKVGALTKPDRTTMAHCLIKFMLGKNGKNTLTRKDFILASKVVAKAFPGESESTYFIPSHGTIAAKGKLYQAYKTYRQNLAAADLIEVRRIAKRKLSTAKPQPDDEIVETPLESIEFLRTHTDPKITILKHWNNCSDNRFVMVASMTVKQYVDNFPVLAMSDGFEWLYIDFKSKFPKAKDGVSEWNVIAKKLVAYAKSISKKDENVKYILAHYEKDNPNGVMGTNSYILMTFKLLCAMLHNTNLPRKGKKGASFRANKLEIINDFLPQFNTELDDKRPMRNYIDVAVYGCLNDKLNMTKVRMESLNYLFADILRGIDCVVKLYYLFDLAFPTSTKNVWDFISFSAYGMEVKGMPASYHELLSNISYMDTSELFKNVSSSTPSSH